MNRTRFVLLPQHFGCLLFDRVGVQYLPFDHDATEVLVALVGLVANGVERKPISIYEIIDSTSDIEQRLAVIAFYEHMSRYDLFEPDGYASVEYVATHPPTDHLAGPLVTHVEVAGSCNIACTHCFAGELPRRHDALTTDEYDQLFAELASMGCYRVSLTGGEPLVNRELFEIIDLAISYGQHPTLTTNGMLIDDHAAREFGRRKTLRLNVSLDGATAATNDAIRGQGVFEKVCERLALLREHKEFSLGFTLTRDSVSEIEDCAQLARELGASAAVFRPLYPAGVAIENQHLMPSFESYIDAVSRLSSGGTVEEDLSELNTECGAGRLLAAVSLQGEVNPCGFLGSDFVAGNIREHSFREIWNDSQRFREMRTEPEAGRMKADASSKQCSGCGGGENSEGYTGGCRSRSLAMSGSVHAADPWHQAYESHPDRYFFPLKNVIVSDE